MNFNLFEGLKKSDVVVSLSVAVTSYLIAPDILTKVETVLFVAALTLLGCLAACQIRQWIEDVQERREELKIRKRRPTNKTVDFQIRRKQVRIPARKVFGNE